MLNLRVYASNVSAGTSGAGGVFYSQRAGGPHYRWQLDEMMSPWRLTPGIARPPARLLKMRAVAPPVWLQAVVRWQPAGLRLH
jgi:hypothetical protein